MKILVTGANGYLGQGIVKTLIENNIQVIATGNSTNRVDCRAECVDVDIFSIEDPFKYFCYPDVILHLAWKDGFVHNSPSHIDNLPAHCDFIHKLIMGGAKHVAVMGSMHEVGFFEGSIDEKTACKPMSFYGIAKNALRQYIELLAYSNQFTYQWLRGYYIVGNSEYGNSIFSKITAAAKSDKKEFPFTMGLNQYDFIDYYDFCYQVAATVCQDEVNGIINICTGRPEKLSSRVERFIEENGYNIKLQYGTFLERPYDSKAVWGNNSKINEILSNSSFKKVDI